MVKILSLFLLLFLVNCATGPKKAGFTTDVGVWQGKVLMTNQKTNHKKWANVTWASDSSKQKMRVDVYALMDIPIATFIKDGEEAHLWLFTEKKYFYSVSGKKLFKYLTKMTLDPNVFFALLGTPVPPSSDWTCNDNKGLFECVSKLDKTSLSVKHDESDQREIRALKDSKALRLRLSRAKVGVDNKHFKLLSTSRYKIIKI